MQRISPAAALVVAIVIGFAVGLLQALLQAVKLIAAMLVVIFAGSLMATQVDNRLEPRAGGREHDCSPSPASS